MVKPDQIIKGEIIYTLEEFYNGLKDLTYQIEVANGKNKEKRFQSLFMFIMLSAEEKSTDTMMEAFSYTKEQVLEGQEAFKEQIDICRAIHMRKFLDIFSEYLPTTSMTLQLLNLWIKDFLKKHIKEKKYGTT